MTKQDREQAVELLRCAADLALREAFALPFITAADGASDVAFAIARDAFVASTLPGTPAGHHYGVRMLEAAQRLEEGSWP